MDDIAITRIMPNSLEAEQSVIGSMLMDKQTVWNYVSGHG